MLYRFHLSYELSQGKKQGKENLVTASLLTKQKEGVKMRFRSINIYSGEQHDGNKKKQLTGLLRNDSDSVVNAYLKSFKYYNNEKCISLNISCDEDIIEPFVEDFVKDYPVLHIPFDLESYSKMKICDKHRFWLKVVYDSIKYVSDIWNWEQAFLMMYIISVYLNLIMKHRNSFILYN